MEIPICWLDPQFEIRFFHSRLIPMYNARFILWPPSLYSPIRKKLYRETGTAKGEGGGEGGDLSRATVVFLLVVFFFFFFKHNFYLQVSWTFLMTLPQLNAKMIFNELRLIRLRQYCVDIWYILNTSCVKYVLCAQWVWPKRYKMPSCDIFPGLYEIVSSLWHKTAKCYDKLGSALTQVISCCLTTPKPLPDPIFTPHQHITMTS